MATATTAMTRQKTEGRRQTETKTKTKNGNNDGDKRQKTDDARQKEKGTARDGRAGGGAGLTVVPGRGLLRAALADLTAPAPGIAPALSLQ